MLLWALNNSQSMLISGIAMIAGIFILRIYNSLRKEKQNSNLNAYEQYKIQQRQWQSATIIPGGNATAIPFQTLENVQTQNHEIPQQNSSQIPQPEHFSDKSQTIAENTLGTFMKNVAESETNRSMRRIAEQFDVEMLTLARQLKAEIDTKIVALQFMIADATRIMNDMEHFLPHAAQAVSAVRDSQSENSQTPSFSQKQNSPQNSQDLQKPLSPQNSCLSQNLQTAQSKNSSTDSLISNMSEMVVEDPFAESDFGLTRAIHELDQLTAKIPTFDSMQSLERTTAIPTQTSQQNLPQEQAQSEQALPIEITPLESWNTPSLYPMSYSISDYQKTQSEHDSSLCHSDKSDFSPIVFPTQKSFSSGHTTVIRGEFLDESFAQNNTANKSNSLKNRKFYTNKILSQSAPQIDSLITDEPTQKMGSDPQPLTPPIIRPVSPPNARQILSEGEAYLPIDIQELNARRTKRHQLQYLLQKGMSPKEIAAYLEMPVGEVELLVSLQNRLSGENAKAASAIRSNGKIVSNKKKSGGKQVT
jgi:hypothetical protein